MKEFLRLLRPYQWVKNGFVFVGFLFAKAWHDPDLTLSVVLAVLAFSLVSSSVYILNDLVDRERDRAHPKKRNRPLAAGTVQPGSAVVVLIAVGIAGLALGVWVSPIIFGLLLTYAAQNVLYTYRLRQVAILDVFAIASGFMLRVLVGTVGVGIPPSKWLLLCAIMLALFLGFAKRRAELLRTGDAPDLSRQAPQHYRAETLDAFISVTAAATLVTYAMYTVDAETVQSHQTEALIYTVPIVTYGLFRYLFLLHHQDVGEDTAADLPRDPHILVAILVWLAAVLLVLG